MPIIYPDANCTSNPSPCLVWSPSPAFPPGRFSTKPSRCSKFQEGCQNATRRVLNEADQKLQLVQDKHELVKQVLTYYRQEVRTGERSAGPDPVQLSTGHGLSPTGYTGCDLWQHSSTGALHFRPATWKLFSIHLLVQPHVGHHRSS